MSQGLKKSAKVGHFSDLLIVGGSSKNHLRKFRWGHAVALLK